MLALLIFQGFHTQQRNALEAELVTYQEQLAAALARFEQEKQELAARHKDDLESMAEELKAQHVCPDLTIQKLTP